MFFSSEMRSVQTVSQDRISQCQHHLQSTMLSFKSAITSLVSHLYSTIDVLNSCLFLLKMVDTLVSHERSTQQRLREGERKSKARSTSYLPTTTSYLPTAASPRQFLLIFIFPLLDWFFHNGSRKREEERKSKERTRNQCTIA